MGDDTHKISRRRCDSSLDLSYIARTTRPYSLASGPGSGPGSICADARDAPTVGLMSTDRPCHPAFWRFGGVGVDGGGFHGFGACAHTVMSKSVSHCARIDNATASLQATLASTLLWLRGRRGRMWTCRRSLCLVKGWKSRLSTEVRAEGGRERGCGGYGCGVAMAAAEGGVGGGGGTRCVLVGKREESVAEGPPVRTGKFTPEATGEGVEPCEAKLPSELPG